MSLFTSQDSETAENFLVNLSVLVVNKKYFYAIYTRGAQIISGSEI